MLYAQQVIDSFQHENTFPRYKFTHIPEDCSTAIGLLPVTLICGLRMRREYRERFPRRRIQKKLPVSDPGMYPVMHVGIANLRWRGERSRHSRRMRNTQFYLSGKRSMGQSLHCPGIHRNIKTPYSQYRNFIISIIKMSLAIALSLQ